MSLETALAERLAAELAEVRPRDGAWADLRAALETDPPVALWYRVWDRGLSRRQFLRAAAAAAGSLALPGVPAAPAPLVGLPGAPAAPVPERRSAGYGAPLPYEPVHFDAGAGPPTVYLPGLGFTSDRAAAASDRPVSVTVGRLTLTVHHLAWVEGAAWVDAELAGLPDLDLRDLRQPQLEDASLAVTNGGGSARAATGWQASGFGPDEQGRMASRTLRRLTGVRLGPGEAEVALGGPRLPRGLTARVRLRPAAEVGLPAERLSTASATVRGVTVGVADAAMGADPTVLRLIVSGLSEPWYAQIGARFGRVHDRRGRNAVHELLLRDAEGREYLEEPSLQPIRHDPNLLDDVAHFPRVPPDARGLRLVVPALTVTGVRGTCRLTVPIEGLRLGSKRPVALSGVLAGFPVRVVALELLERDGGLALALDTDLGPPVDGRLLVSPGMVLVDGENRGVTFHWAAGHGERAEVIEVPVPPSAGSSIVLTLHTPAVEVQGPWVVPLG
jgi:hypothetical protein